MISLKLHIIKQTDLPGLPNSNKIDGKSKTGKKMFNLQASFQTFYMIHLRLQTFCNISASQSISKLMTGKLNNSLVQFRSVFKNTLSYKRIQMFIKELAQ